MLPLWALGYTSLVAAASVRVPRQDNDGITLAVHPACGAFGGNFTDVNGGIDLGTVQTIVSFGVGLTFIRPSPFRHAHGVLRYGRGTNVRV